MSSCPVATRSSECVLLSHGEGGRMMRQLLHERIAPILTNEPDWQDAAHRSLPTQEIAVTTDSFVVSPIFFPGGDIGSLSVYGTVNDLAVSGANADYLTLALILEEGMALSDLDRILASIHRAAQRCEVSIVAGDTKVVPQGAVDRLFINTTGIGTRHSKAVLRCDQIQTGDQLIVSGPIGQHGMAVMSARQSLQLQPAPQSDSAPLQDVCRDLSDQLGPALHSMRDATRGGLSAVLHEWAEATQLSMSLRESQIPISGEVRGIAELLGLDPLYVACEGVFVAAVEREQADLAIKVLRQHPVASSANIVGEVVNPLSAPVVIQRVLGSLQPVDEPTGAPLPRIC